ncbi:Spy/CpxP family protein refolding chaperone, partial [Caulobacter sp. S45]|uniref:Spy/CpxP family protein refolding chaperone n=1 Tax=Caulobacter sp. S45 TaxID=1641861 RepID=UPI0015755189
MNRTHRRGSWTTGLALAAALLTGAGAAMAQPPLDALPSILQLELSQHPAWRAYKDASAERQADAAHSVSQAAQLNAMTTPQRLDALRSQMQAQQQSFEQQASATEAFYAVLSPDQRRIFDEVTRLPTLPSPLRANASMDPGSPQILRLPPA